MRAALGLLAAVIALAALPVSAQDCHIGVYIDEEGFDSSLDHVRLNQYFNIYVVMLVEAPVNAASYITTTPPGFFVSAEAFGPSGGGINIFIQGYNVGLGECAIGFGGAPILVAKYTLIMPYPVNSNQEFTIEANPDEDPKFPVYSDCGGALHRCESTSNLALITVGTKNHSFGAVKSLYGN